MRRARGADLPGEPYENQRAGPFQGIDQERRVQDQRAEPERDRKHHEAHADRDPEERWQATQHANLPARGSQQRVGRTRRARDGDREADEREHLLNAHERRTYTLANMRASVDIAAHVGLERSCGDWVRSTGPAHGIQLLRARLAHGFDPHRHDTYGIAVTEFGVQTFAYRGSLERSLPGQVTVLHPDERHDGRAGTEAGFGYRIVYVAPSHIGAALQDIAGKPSPLPFVSEPVTFSPTLASAVMRAFASRLEPLQRDALIVQIAEALRTADSSLPALRTTSHLDPRALRLAKEFLDAERRVVSSSELEQLTGLSRYTLARQFRVAFATSPYRYSVLRRLDHACCALKQGGPLADVALSAGFADQAHFTRMFRATYGLPPGRFAAITRADDSHA